MDRIVSAAIALYILVVLYVLEGLPGLLVVVALVPTLGCIWFNELLGSMTGSATRLSLKNRPDALSPVLPGFF